jgi:hypothetical protein
VLDGRGQGGRVTVGVDPCEDPPAPVAGSTTQPRRSVFF